VTEADARAAGFESRSALAAATSGKEALLYLVRRHLAGPDPLIALRERAPGAGELAELRGRLDRWDRASPVGPWTRAALRLIAGNPERRAAHLAALSGIETARFKTNVRRLEGLGLTESLEIGYRLSPRGRAALEALDDLDG